MNRYTVGNTIRLRATLLNDKDVLLDALAVRCAVTAPGQITPTELLVHADGPGGVTADYVPTIPGVHSYAFTNLSPLANGERQFLAVARRVAPLPG